jgi:hypothetical protein
MSADCLGSCNIELGNLGEHPQSAVDLSSDAERSREEADGITLVQIIGGAKQNASLNTGPNFHSTQPPYIWASSHSSWVLAKNSARMIDAEVTRSWVRFRRVLGAKRPPPWIWPFDVAVSCSGGNPSLGD